MLKKMMMTAVLLIVLSGINLMAQNGQSFGAGPGNGTCAFIDENGDGINDNFRDHDGDGVPNHLDTDWKRPQDGTGNQGKNGRGAAFRSQRGQGGFGQFREARQLGGGFGSGSCTGTGICDGSGVRKGGGRKGGRR